MAKYSKQIVEKIYDLISSDSYSIVEVCEIVGINKDTYYTWLKTKPDFSDTIKKAEEERHAFMRVEAEKSLKKKIQGYTVEETKIVYVDSKTGKTDEKGNEITKPKIKEQTVVKKHIPPDTTAIIFTLVNRDPDNWKNRQENKISGDVGIKSHLENLSDEELQKIVDGEVE